MSNSISEYQHQKQKSVLRSTQNLFLIFHVFFILIAVFMMAMPLPIGVGWRLFLLVMVYNIAFPLFSIWGQNKELFDIWSFLLPLSILQVFPDWFLSSELKILVFPEDGFLKIGTVSAYMAGLWVIPLMSVLYISEEIRQKYGNNQAFITSGFSALLIFGLSEATSKSLLSSWYAQNVQMIGDMALYVLLPEMILGFAAYEAFRSSMDKGPMFKLRSAFVVMLIYTGSLMFFYFLFEKIIFS